MLGSRFLACIALVLVPAALVWPQAQPEIVSHEAPATFSSRINLVTVPVVVRDREGHPVGNLSQEDFQLFDKGKVQVISRFSIETNGSAAAKAPDTPARDQGFPPPEASKPALPSRYVAYLFDDVHSKVGDLLQGRQAASAQLDRSLKDPGTRVGIFTTSGRTTQDFAADAEKLHAAINRIQPWTQGPGNQDDCPSISYYVADLLVNQTQSLSPGLSDSQVLSRTGDQTLGAIIQEAEACLHTTNMQVVLPQVRSAAQLALSVGKNETMSGLSVLLGLVRSMSSLPGNRSVVMVSPGFLLATDQRVFENDVFEKAIHAKVTINTLDVRGVPPESPERKPASADIKGRRVRFCRKPISLRHRWHRIC